MKEEEPNQSTGYLGGEPRHDMERRLDELHRRLQQQRHAQAAGADARDRQPTRTNGSITSDKQVGWWRGEQSELYFRARKEEEREEGRRGVPDDPDDCADDGDEEGEDREGQAENEPERPAPAVAMVVAAAATAAAHLS